MIYGVLAKPCVLMLHSFIVAFIRYRTKFYIGLIDMEKTTQLRKIRLELIFLMLSEDPELTMQVKDLLKRL